MILTVSEIKCNCQHLPKDHFNNEGSCNKCGCTWYRPNDDFIIKNPEIKKIIDLLRTSRVHLNDEKITQGQIESVLAQNMIEYKREFRLDSLNIIDFYTEGIGIEVKISGRARKIYQQVVRYCTFPEIKVMILVTNRSIGLPEFINGVPCYVVNIGKAWL